MTISEKSNTKLRKNNFTTYNSTYYSILATAGNEYHFDDTCLSAVLYMY